MHKDRKKSISLRSILIIYLMVLVVASISVVGFFTYGKFSEKMTRQVALSRVDVLAQISERVSAVLNSVTVLANFYYFNLPIAADADPMVLFNDIEETEIISRFRQLDLLYAKTAEATNLVFHYVLTLENGFHYDSQRAFDPLYAIENYKKKLWYANILQAEGKPVWISTIKDFSKDGSYVFSFARSIVNPSTGQSIGLFIVNVDEKSLSSTYEKLISNDKQVSDNAIYLVDQNGLILSHSNKDMLSINFYDMKRFASIFGDERYAIINKNTGSYLFSKYVNPDQGWLVVEEIPLSSILGVLREIRYDIVIIALLVILISLFIVSGIAVRTARPLSRLCTDLERVGQDETFNRFNVRGWHEINRICDECNQMSGRIGTLLDDVKAKESAKRQAEMRFMQAQMSPHFVYNTLFSIKCLVDMGDREKAIGIIESFTAILKNILSHTDEFITIENEVRLLNDYITLQKYRYGDFFNFETAVPDGFKSYRILRMLLQPLVENAIFHGLKNRPDRGLIRVSLDKLGEDIRITVEDNGIGMSAENLADIWSGKRLDTGNRSNMIGIRNISDRIKLQFGDTYQISIESQPLLGTKIILKLPCLE